MEWVRIHKLPDYVYFDHSVHVTAGVGCVECHGRIDQMERVRMDKPLSMGWCLECHRDVRAKQGDSEHIRPVSQMTNMDWTHEAHVDPPRHLNPPENCCGVPPMSKRAPYPVREPWPGSPQYWRSLEERSRLGDPALRERERGRVSKGPRRDAADRRGLAGQSARSARRDGGDLRPRRGRGLPPSGREDRARTRRCRRTSSRACPSHYATRRPASRRRASGSSSSRTRGARRRSRATSRTRRASARRTSSPRRRSSTSTIPSARRRRARAATPRPGRSSTRSCRARLAAFDADQGARLRVLMPPTISPTVLRMRAALAQRFPKARVHTWSAVSDSNAREGARLAFGQPVNTLYAYDRARVIVVARQRFPADRDGQRPRDEALRRRPAAALVARLDEPPLRRRAGADHDGHERGPPPAPPGERHRALRARAGGRAREERRRAWATTFSARVGEVERADGIPAKWLTAVAKDLVANKGRALRRRRLAPARRRVHALAHAINAALGAPGASLTHAPAADADELDAATDLKALTDAIGAGQVDTLVILGGNPVYDAPADLEFGDKLAKVPFSVHASLFVDETSEKCTWHVPRAHELESWGDARALDGSVSVQQPLIAPLYGGRSDIELLALMATASEKSAHDAVRATIVRRAMLATARPDRLRPVRSTARSSATTPRATPPRVRANDLEREWNRALATRRRGPGAAASAAAPRCGRRVAAAIEKRRSRARVGAGYPRGHLRAVPQDGRRAPREQHVAPGAAGPRHEARLGQRRDPLAGDRQGARRREQGHRSRSRVGRPVDRPPARGSCPARPTTRSRSRSAGAARKAGRIGNGRGFDVYPLRTTQTLGFAVGAHVTKTRRAVLLRADAGARLDGGSSDRARGDARRVQAEARTSRSSTRRRRARCRSGPSRTTARATSGA